MPILPQDDEQPDRLGVRAIKGSEWNETIDYMQRITPRGDGKQTYATPTSSGTKIESIPVAVDDGGGVSLSRLPAKALTDGHALVTGKEWNKLLDYAAAITPVTDGETATGKSISDGWQITFPEPEPEPEPNECTDFPFYLNVTVTGGTYPFEWLGRTWASSGQTFPICGTGSQRMSFYTNYYAPYFPYQSWNAVDGSLTLDAFPATFGYLNRFLRVKRTGTISPFLLSLEVGGFTYFPYYFYNKATTGLNNYSPTLSNFFTASQTDYAQIAAVHMGSLTLTSGRTISWVANPALPWDYDNPPT